ncbi:conserved exported hypothetical protein [Candidatus Zixiibacteriota bacterium]|nr:conserved exported hypothetical protein [candidate division Zixibacteria bacterium]
MRKLLLLAAGVLFVLGGTAYAFHDEGVARCAGCHTMHNSQNNALVDPNSPNGNPWLLKDATPSDVCLSCHAVTHGNEFTGTPLNPPAQTAAGSFIFLTATNLNEGRSGSYPGYAAGHSIVAPGYALAADGAVLSAPGGGAGAFPSASLGCSSCHDPHGNMNFRMLYGIGAIQDGLFTFTNAAPIAEGVSYNDTVSNTIHTAYHSGMSAWCGNCHGDFHNNNTKLIHPSGRALGGTIAGIYNRYNGTGDQNGAVQATSFLELVPFEDAAMTTTSTTGPTASSQVMCLTCHRAHATSSPDAGRWDFTISVWSEEGVRSGTYAIPNPYPNPLADQRSLCNKCHNKDVNDLLLP